MSALPDVTRLSVKDLLRLEAIIIAELRARELVRTNNKPLGDIAERIVLAARGGVLEPNSTKSHDITDRDGRRIQVKAMGRTPEARGGAFSFFRSFDFDVAVFLVFASDTFEIMLAREMDANAAETTARYVRHTNGRQSTLRQVESLGTDVTEEMRLAYETLDVWAPALRRKEV